MTFKPGDKVVYSQQEFSFLDSWILAGSVGEIISHKDTENKFIVEFEGARHRIPGCCLEHAKECENCC